jgi:hypothetical protein
LVPDDNHDSEPNRQVRRKPAAELWAKVGDGMKG